MAGIKDYSTTPANNTALFPEGMAPSAVNDGMRQVQADIREWFNDAEWILYGDGDEAFSLTYASATSFNVGGINVTGKYHAGRRVKATGALTGTIYGTIASSSFATNTVVNIAWDSGALQNESLTVYLGALSATNQSIPPGFAGGITGEIRMYGGSSAPTGWQLCNGAALSRTTFAALFAVLGTTFGAGDGSTTFTLPDLRGRVPVGAGQGTGLTNRALGAAVGAETHQLATNELPVHAHAQQGTFTSGGISADHTHNITLPTQAGNAAIGAGARWSGDNVGQGNATGTTGGASNSHTHDVTIGGSTGNAGSGAAHNNMQPSLAVNYIIKI